MNPKAIFSLSFVAMAALTLSVTLADAQDRGKARTDRIRVAYVEPKNPEHAQLYEQMKASRVLERIRMLMSPVRLPARLLLKTEGCDGVVNAWYFEQAVTVCYEYLAEAIRNAPQKSIGEVTREGAILGAAADVFLHELAHALFDMLEIPIFGREEDAADQLAAYLMLQMGSQEARNLVAGTAYLYAVEVMQKSPRLKDFADAHGLPAQRFFNLLCMAYGSSPKTYQDIVDKGLLPKDRAEGCEDEYAQVEHAYQTLILPHVDRRLAAKVRARVRSGKWKELLSPKLLNPNS